MTIWIWTINQDLHLVGLTYHSIVSPGSRNMPDMGRIQVVTCGTYWSANCVALPWTHQSKLWTAAEIQYATTVLLSGNTNSRMSEAMKFIEPQMGNHSLIAPSVDQLIGDLILYSNINLPCKFCLQLVTPSAWTSSINQTIVRRYRHAWRGWKKSHIT